MVTIIKSYKIRLLPTKEQEQKLWQHVHAQRFIYNWALSLNMSRFENDEKKLSGYDLGKLVTQLKKTDDYKWLNEVSSKTLKQSVIDLDNAYGRFFTKQKKGPKFSENCKVKTVYNMLGHPKFKKRHKCKDSFYSNYEGFYLQPDVAVMDVIGKVKYKTDFELPTVNKKQEMTQKFTNPRISYVNNKWIASFGYETEVEKPVLTDKVLGIDLGVKTLAVVSDGSKYKNINKTRAMNKLDKRMRQTGRKLSRQIKSSTSYVRTKHKLKAIHTKITNKRLDHIHKMTADMVSKLPRAIVIEDLNVSGMMTNRHLSRAISQCNFYEIRRQLEYKCKIKGIELILADRFYPSSKKCSSCGLIKKDLKLKDRKYECHCGLKLDRDMNAAKNLEKLAFVI
ncbi:MAG: transposase [Defluviitaleaceae bacterium]|nr:transposase [Defluviitaleaceae bacterium]